MEVDKKPTHDEKIVNFVMDYIRERGYSPTVREVGSAIGISSSSTAHKVLDAAVSREIILMDAKVARSIRVSQKGLRLYGRN